MTEFIPVGSTAIQAVAHDPATNTLKIRFTSGSEYHFSDVPHEHFAALTDPNRSAGRYVNQHIFGKYPSKKIERA